LIGEREDAAHAFGRSTFRVIHGGSLSHGVWYPSDRSG
jgi:hypothetical protein